MNAPLPPSLPPSTRAALRRRGLWQRMLEAQARERSQLLREMVQIKGLMPLLMKRRNGSRWTRADRQILRAQVNAMAHVSPYLVVLVLPGSFALLPVLAWWLDRRRLRRPQDDHMASA